MCYDTSRVIKIALYFLCLVLVVIVNLFSSFLLHKIISIVSVTVVSYNIFDLPCL